jgi:hypothetical protein
MEWTLP